MSLIPDEIREKVRKQLSENLVNPVRILMFTQELECKFCSDTKQLIIELSSMSDKIQAEVRDFVADSVLAQEYGVENLPAVVITNERGYKIKFYGLPYGYEFQTLLTALLTVSSGKTNLATETKEKLASIRAPTNVKIFVSLTCPYCPMIAAMSCMFSVENNLVSTEIIDASEFPHLAQKYAVMGVPKIVINEKEEFIGAVPESTFLEHVLVAIR